MEINTFKFKYDEPTTHILEDPSFDMFIYFENHVKRCFNSDLFGPNFEERFVTKDGSRLAKVNSFDDNCTNNTNVSIYT